MDTHERHPARFIDLADLPEEAVQVVESFVRLLRVTERGEGDPGPRLLDEASFERGLDELSEGLEGLPTLPGDFSRADIYEGHLPRERAVLQDAERCPRW